MVRVYTVLGLPVIQQIATVLDVEPSDLGHLDEQRYAGWIDACSGQP